MSEAKTKIRWGKSTWDLFHTLAEKIDADYYMKNRWQILDMIKKICFYLPCPDCAGHATRFLSKVKVESIPNKNQFRAMLFYFHNSVNARVGKQQFKFKHLDVYKNFNLGIALNNFIIYFAKRYNSTLRAGITSTEIDRKKIAHSVTIWFKTNWRNFA
jgi:hypothetical protein